MNSWLVKNRKSVISWVFVLLVLGTGILVAPFSGLETQFFGGKKLVIDALPDLSQNRFVATCQLLAAHPGILEKNVSIPLSKWLMAQSDIADVQALTMNSEVFFYIKMRDRFSFDRSYNLLGDILDRTPSDLLPDGAILELGPPSSAVHQAYGFVLIQKDTNGTFKAILDPHELASLLEKDFLPELQYIQGVSEVAQLGGAKSEIQIIPDMQALQGWGISLESFTSQVNKALEIPGSGMASGNGVEYYVSWESENRDLDFYRGILIDGHNGITSLSDIAAIQRGPAYRSNLLMYHGRETSGAFISLYPDADPSVVITEVQERLQNSVQKWNNQYLGKGELGILEFYNRKDLVLKNSKTLREALILECMIAVFIMWIFMRRFKMAMAIAIMVPLTMAFVFGLMYFLGMRINMLSTAGLILAIGTIVDFGIIFSQTAEQNFNNDSEPDFGQALKQARKLTMPLFASFASILIIAFLPVFFLSGDDGKMFTPLALTKTFMMLSAVGLTLWLLPELILSLMRVSLDIKSTYLLLGLIIIILLFINLLIGIAAAILALVYLFFQKKPWVKPYLNKGIASIFLCIYCFYWAPLGKQEWPLLNLMTGLCLAGGILWTLHTIQVSYARIFKKVLRYSGFYMLSIILILFLGLISWARIPESSLPVLQEGVFLHMPGLPPGADISEVKDYGLILDSLYRSVPEVKTAIIKAGRSNSVLDPAPLSMFENFILTNDQLVKDENGKSIPAVQSGPGFMQISDPGFFTRWFSKPLPAWRSNIQSHEEIGDILVSGSHIGGLSHAPALQPVQARMLMQETGVQSPYYVKIEAKDQRKLDTLAEDVKSLLLSMDEVDPYSIFYDKPTSSDYLKIIPDKSKLKNAGITQAHLSHHLAHSFELHSHSDQSYENYQDPVRIFLGTAFSKTRESIAEIPVSNHKGEIFVVGDLAEIQYEEGPGMLRHDQGNLYATVTFFVKDGYHTQQVLHTIQESLRKLQDKSNSVLKIDGEYEQIRKSTRRNIMLLLCSLLIISLILYWRLNSIVLTGIVLLSVCTTLSAGMLLYYLAGTEWASILFLQENLRLHTGAWIGFIALSGLAVQESLIMLSNIKAEIRTEGDLETQIRAAGEKRVGAAMLTIGTTLLALIPIVTGKGFGHEMLVPLVLPIVGGLLFQLWGVFLTPLLAIKYFSKKQI